MTPEQSQLSRSPSAPRKELTRSVLIDSIPFWIRNKSDTSNYRRPLVISESTLDHNDSRQSSSIEELRRPAPAIKHLLPHLWLSIEQALPSKPPKQLPNVADADAIPPNMASNQPNAALLEQIKAIINRAITARIATPQPGSVPPDQAKDAEQPNAQWYVADLGFFDPNYDNKTITLGEAMEHAGKDTIFRDVYLFIERAKDIAAVWGDKIVRQNISTSLSKPASYIA